MCICQIIKFVILSCTDSMSRVVYTYKKNDPLTPFQYFFDILQFAEFSQNYLKQRSLLWDKGALFPIDQCLRQCVKAHQNHYWIMHTFTLGFASKRKRFLCDSEYSARNKILKGHNYLQVWTYYSQWEMCYLEDCFPFACSFHLSAIPREISLTNNSCLGMFLRQLTRILVDTRELTEINNMIYSCASPRV